MPVLTCHDLGYIYHIALPEGATVNDMCEVTLPDEEPEWFRLCGPMLLDAARDGDLFEGVRLVSQTPNNLPEPDAEILAGISPLILVSVEELAGTMPAS
jgi:hypothetical protein